MLKREVRYQATNIALETTRLRGPHCSKRTSMNIWRNYLPQRVHLDEALSVLLIYGVFFSMLKGLFGQPCCAESRDRELDL